MRISELTRRDITDAIVLEHINIYGRLEEIEFLSRIFDLKAMPSNDGRFPNVHGDIWQHTINNSDWDGDWIWSDDRFNLRRGDDEIFLRFLCETIHPVVRSDSTEAYRLQQLYNNCLKNDGFEIVEKTRLSNKPVFVGRYIGSIGTPVITAAKDVLASIDATYVSQQITRMEAAVDNDPSLAIGTAKEFLETCCKTILKERVGNIDGNIDLPQLVKKASKELELTPDDIPDKAKAVNTIRKLLSNLASITSGIAELRNSYGTGHGKEAKSKGLSARHAKLAVGAASTLGIFLVETHLDKKKQ